MNTFSTVNIMEWVLQACRKQQGEYAIRTDKVWIRQVWIQQHDWTITSLDQLFLHIKKSNETENIRRKMEITDIQNLITIFLIDNWEQQSMRLFYCCFYMSTWHLVILLDTATRCSACWSRSWFGQLQIQTDIYEAGHRTFFYLYSIIRKTYVKSKEETSDEWNANHCDTVAMACQPHVSTSPV